MAVNLIFYLFCFALSTLIYLSDRTGKTIADALKQITIMILFWLGLQILIFMIDRGNFISQLINFFNVNKYMASDRSHSKMLGVLGIGSVYLFYNFLILADLILSTKQKSDIP